MSAQHDYAELLNKLEEAKGLIAGLNNVVRNQQQELNAYRRAFDGLSTVLFETDGAGNLVFCSKGAEQFFGCSEDTVIKDSTVLAGIAPIDRDRVKKDMLEVYRRKGRIIQEYLAVKQDGSLFPVMIELAPLLADGKPQGVRGVMMKACLDREMDEKFRYMNLHDSLTGIYNRAYFDQSLKCFSTSDSQPVSLIICDVDGLKMINDIMGHEKGDIILKAAADVLKKCFRGNDIVARLGGDEFGVLLPKTPESNLPGYYTRIQDAIAAYNKDHPEIPLHISVGYATASEKINTMEQLFTEADQNMYREKFSHYQTERLTMVKNLYHSKEAFKVLKKEALNLAGVMSLL